MEATSTSVSRRDGKQQEGFDDEDEDEEETIQVVRSPLSLLEHVNLNVPNHDYILSFYFDLLGFGVDPRRAQNIAKGSKTVWANCGSSQFHLPFDEKPQCIPGQIGLCYDSLDGLKERLAQTKGDDDPPFLEYKVGFDPVSRVEYVRIVDRYENVFYCRANNNSNHVLEDEVKQQPIVSKDDTEEFGSVAMRYGVNHETTECRGIDYVEWYCPEGTAAKIARFYETLFGAATSVLPQQRQHSGLSLAVVGLGNHVEENDKKYTSQQCLLFRETRDPVPPYDGHHVALYVGWPAQPNVFDDVFQRAAEAGIVWMNPRFSDKAIDQESAKRYQQFRFKDIVDVDAEEKHVVFQLEHEIRCVLHPAYPGQA